MYNKEVQTADFEEEDGERMTVEQLRVQIAKEYEAHHVQKERELEEESAKLDREIEEEIRGQPTSTSDQRATDVASLEFTEEERANVFIAPEFLSFVEQSSKIVQRALNDNYDYTRDYTIGAQTGE
jgi:dynein intermediate chain